MPKKRKKPQYKSKASKRRAKAFLYGTGICKSKGRRRR